MPTKLKRTLFIGLGGTGAEAILHTKKNFVDAYNEIPPMIGFLSIDTDRAITNKKIKSKLFEDVKIEGNEFVYNRVMAAKSAFLARKDELFSWLPPENIPSLKDMTHGAGQIRSNGRFALHFNYNAIHDAIENKLNQILHMSIIDNNKYEANGEGIEINFVFSVGGGTGSGSFIDIAYLLKEAIQKFSSIPISVQAFAVLPDVFAALGPNDLKLQNVRPNGYGALVDLDYLMHIQYGESPWTIKYESKTIEVNEPPFDVVFTINNQNRAGHIISEVSELGEMIGLGLFTGASELSAGIESAYDNVKSAMATNRLDLHNKKAWASGMGISVGLYDGNKLANIYAYSAIDKTISKLLSPIVSVNEVNSFIDDDEVRIRENNDHDDVIDALLQPEPSIRYSVSDSSNAAAEIQMYLKAVAEQAELKVAENYEDKQRAVARKLSSELIKSINSEHGVGNCIEFVAQLSQQLDAFREEMEAELKELQEQRPVLESQKDSLLMELDGLKSGFKLMGKGKAVAEKTAEVEEMVALMAMNQHEIIRRKWAIRFFNSLSKNVKDIADNLAVIKSKLSTVRNKAIQKINAIYNELDSKNKTFIIELHKQDIKKVVVKDEELSFHSLLSKIPTKNQIFDFASVPDKEIESFFWEYARNHEKALAWRNRPIDDVLNGMTEEEINHVIHQLAVKSTPLWSYDFRGLSLSPNLFNEFVIGVPHREDSRIFKKDQNNELNLASDGNSKVNFMSTFVNDRVVFYRMEAAVPIYSVNDVAGYCKKYKNITNINYHIDQHLKDRMDREKFDILPKKEENTSHLATWVGGLIYGFIKNEDGNYMVYSTEHGDELDDYWMPLATNNYRDDAFKKYCSMSLHAEMEDLINAKVAKMGTEANNIIVEEIREGSNYLNKFSQVGMTREDLKKKEWSGISDLIRKEIGFAKNHFAN